MATYVMSDIHGCFDEMQQMFKKIGFSDEDKLIIAGDIVDRGSKNREMLDWMLDAPDNVEFLMGNHDRMFVTSVYQLDEYSKSEPSLKDAYRMAAYESWAGFDNYKTIKKLISRENVGMHKLRIWADKIETFRYLKKMNVNGRNFIIVHAGYADENKLDKLPSFGYENVEDFYVWARDEAISCGGKEHTTIISGHTPTISEGIFYNKGKVKRIVDEERDCIFYNIDCGCVFGAHYKDARLACIRLEDEEIFYV
jgi:serine/threonine protein phosphatase 1